MRPSRFATWAWVPPATHVVLFLFIPLIVVLLYALGYGASGWRHLPQIFLAPQEATMRAAQALVSLLSDAYFRNRIVFTLLQAAASTLLTLVLGVPLAYAIAQHRFPGRAALRAVLTVPFVLPPIVVALALRTSMPDALAAIGPVGAILLAHLYYNLGLVVRLVGNLWERLPSGLLETARNLGASPQRTFWTVHVPLIRPALAAAALLVFVFTATSFGIILFLGAQPGGARVGTIETAIYETLRGFRPRYATAAALAMVQLVVTYTALSAFVLLQRRLRVGLTPRVETARSRLPWPAAVALVAAAAFILWPLMHVVASSFRYAGEWSLEPWRIAASGRFGLGSYTMWDAVRNSLVYASCTLLLALPLAVLLAVAGRHRDRSAGLQALLMMPLGVSSVLIGLGLLLAWDGDPLPDLRASPLRIVAAHTLVAFPFAARVLAPALESIAPTLRDAARTLGATPAGVTRRIDLPLVRPALAVAAVFIIATSLGEFGASLLLRRPETTTIPLAIADALGRLGEPFRAQAAVYADLLILVALAGFLLVERLRGARGGDLL